MIPVAFYHQEPEELTEILKDIQGLNLEITITCFSDLPSLMDSPIGFQIIFIYISSKDKDTSSLEPIEDLRCRMPSVSLVFLSDTRYFALDAFRLHAAHYLISPFSQTELMSALTRCFLEQHILTERMLKIKPVKNPVPAFVPLSDISYIEIIRKIVILHTENMEYHTYSTLSSISRQLDENFFQVHKSYIINMNKISSLDANDVILKDGRQIPLSRRNKAALKERYQNFAAKPKADVYDWRS